MKMLKSKKLLGFTLIELLIVIAIIGILAVAFLPSLLGAPAKGRDAQRTTAVQKIENFLVAHMLKPGVTLPAADECINPTSTAGANTISKLIYDNVESFGGKLPFDPQSTNVTTGAIPACTGQYGYIRFTANTKYSIAVYARVENAENANILCSDIKDVAAAPTLATSPLAAGAVGCYLVLLQ